MKLRKNRKLLSVITAAALMTQLAVAMPTTYAIEGIVSSSKSGDTVANATYGRGNNQAYVPKHQVNKERKIISNGLTGTYYKGTGFTEAVLIRMEDAESAFNLSQLAASVPEALKETFSGVHSIRWEGLLNVPDSDTYAFHILNNEHVNVWVNGTLVAGNSGGTVQEMKLESGQEYALKIEYSNASNLADFALTWSGKKRGTETIQREFLAPKKNNQTAEPKAIGKTKKSDEVRILSAETPTVDTDGDTIPDVWEKSGYTYLFGIGLVAWDDSYATTYNAQKYTTSPSSISTDQDPYTDYEEVTGQIDAAIQSPADDPLIPAFPDVTATLSKIQVSPNGTVTTTDGIAKTTGWTDSTTTTDNTIRTDGWKAGLEVSAGYKVGTSTEASGNIKAYGEYNGSVQTGSSTAKLVSENGTDAANWSQATATNPSQAATAILNVSYTNNGTAPVYYMSPTLSLQVGDETAVTLKPSDSSTVETISPDATYPSSGTVALQYNDTGSSSVPFYLTLDQLKLIEMGYPISLSMDQMSAKVKTFTNGTPTFTESWTAYQSAINNVTADIVFKSPSAGTKQYKVYGNSTYISPSSLEADESYNPTNNPVVTLSDALETVLGAEIITVNNVQKVYLNGEEVTDSWRIYFTADNTTDKNTLLTTTNFDAISMRPGMKVYIENPEAAGTPDTQYAFYDEDGKQIQAKVFANGSTISSVTATVKTSAGVSQTFNLIDVDTNGEYDNIYKLSAALTSALDMSYAGATITATAANGQSKTIYLLKPYDYFVGSGFVPVTRQKVTDLSMLTSTYPTAQSFVLEVNNDRVATNNQKVTIGNHSSYMGVTNPFVEYKAAATTYSLFTDTNYGGSSYPVSSTLTDLRGVSGSYNDKTSSLLMRNWASGAGIIMFTEKESSGTSASFTGSVSSSTNLNGLNDLVTSVRVIGQSGKPYLRLYDDTNYGGSYFDVIQKVNSFPSELNDKFSSFKTIAPSDTTNYVGVKLWEHSNTGGKYCWYSSTYYPSHPDLGTSCNNFSNFVSSAEIVTSDLGPKFTFYTGTNYTGSSQTITPGTDLSSTVTYNEQYSSVKVENNSNKLSKMIIYTENNFEGSYAVIDESISDLSNFQDVIYKASSQTGLNMNDKISSARFYFGPIYRFYTNYSYSGNYTDYIIGTTSVGSSNDNGFSSVKVYNPLPEIGLIAYDGTNYTGTAYSVTDKISSMSTFNDKVSSLKLVTRTPYYRPNSNTTMVVPASQVSSMTTSGDVLGSGTSVYLLGYNTSSGTSYKFNASSQSVSYSQADLGTTKTFYTNATKAKGYLFQVEASRVTSDVVTINVNGVPAELATSASKNLGFDSGAFYLPIRNNLIFVPANSSNASQITVNLGVGAWRSDLSQASFNIKMVGYFAEDSVSTNDSYFDALTTPSSVGTIFTNQSNITKEVSKSDFSSTPTGYLVKVTASNTGGDMVGLTVNDNTAHLATGATVDALGLTPSAVTTSGLIYVTASNTSPYSLTLSSILGGWAPSTTGQFDVEVVGYFHN